MEKLIDDSVEQQEHFKIDSDELAEWALQKIAEYRQESQRYISVCENMMASYKGKIEDENKRLVNKAFYLENELKNYFMTVERKCTKTQQSYRLPTGNLKLKYVAPEIKRDDAKLLEWIEQNRLHEYIVTTQKPNWAEFKKMLVFDNGKAITADGEIIDGIEAIEREPEFKIEL